MFKNVDFFPALDKRLQTHFFQGEKKEQLIVLYNINKAVKCKQS